MRKLFIVLIYFVHVNEAKNGTGLQDVHKYNCKNIKCPTTKNPVCVKVKHNGKKQKDYFVLAINECEINYAKCRPGIEAIIVPMKNCGYDGAISKKILSRKKRARRQSSQSSSSSEYFDGDKQPYDTDDTKPSNHIEAGSDDSLGDYAGDTTGSDDDDVGNSRSEGYNTKQKLSHGLNDGGDGQELGDERNDGDDDGSQETTNLSGITTFGAKNKNKTMGTGNPADLLAKQALLDEKKDRKNEDDTILDPDFDKTGEEKEVNFVDYNEECPAMTYDCPVRDKMVCGRSRIDGHFQTFNSLCEFRQIACYWQQAEKWTLVSRQPCLLGGRIGQLNEPYVRARLSDPADDDPVLKYIRCRELERSNQDPRCQF